MQPGAPLILPRAARSETPCRWFRTGDPSSIRTESRRRGGRHGRPREVSVNPLAPRGRVSVPVDSTRSPPSPRQTRPRAALAAPASHGNGARGLLPRARWRPHARGGPGNGGGRNGCRRERAQHRSGPLTERLLCATHRVSRKEAAASKTIRSPPPPRPPGICDLGPAPESAQAACRLWGPQGSPPVLVQLPT